LEYDGYDLHRREQVRVVFLRPEIRDANTREPARPAGSWRLAVWFANEIRDVQTRSIPSCDRDHPASDSLTAITRPADGRRPVRFHGTFFRCISAKMVVPENQRMALSNATNIAVRARGRPEFHSRADAGQAVASSPVEPVCSSQIQTPTSGKTVSASGPRRAWCKCERKRSRGRRFAMFTAIRPSASVQGIHNLQDANHGQRCSNNSRNASRKPSSECCCAQGAR